MRRWAIRVVALLLLAATGCPGRASTPSDRGGRVESSLVWPDGSHPDLRRDATPPADLKRDAAATGTSCKATIDCAIQCTTADCVTACVSATCAAGSGLAQALVLCAAQNCLSSCASGYNQSCVSCIVSHCKLQYAACLLQTSCN